MIVFGLFICVEGISQFQCILFDVNFLEIMQYINFAFIDIKNMDTMIAMRMQDR